MARFRYTGDSERPQIILGLTFTADGWTDVPDALVERLSGHSHLEGEDAAPPDAEEAPKRRGRPPKAREG